MERHKLLARKLRFVCELGIYIKAGLYAYRSILIEKGNHQNSSTRFFPALLAPLVFVSYIDYLGELGMVL
jgi:hypothetical protein